MSMSCPKAPKVAINWDLFYRTLSGATLPRRTNALVVSQPVKEWRAGSTSQMSDSFADTMPFTFRSPLLFLILVSKRIVLSITCENFGKRTNTSVSGDLTTITDVGWCWAMCWQCKIMRVSASSWELNRSSSGRASTRTPVPLVKQIQSSLQTKTNCLPRSLAAYLGLLHSERRSFIDWVLFSSFDMNSFQSRGVLVFGPERRNVGAISRRHLSNNLIDCSR